jgi:hypothetical protein
MVKIPALLLCLLAVGPVAAETLRCGNDLITEGDPQLRVQRLCGEPADVQRTVEFREASYWIDGRLVQVAGGWREVPIETWTYNFGPNRFMRRLRFEDGLVVAIETLGYGHLP